MRRRLSWHHLGVLPTICTAGKHNSTIWTELRLGELPQGAKTVKRNAAKPDDTKALDALRQDLPGAEKRRSDRSGTGVEAD